MALPKGQNPKELTIKQRRFIDNFCNPQSETYGQTVKSYIKAGYKDSPSANISASILLNNPKIEKELAKYEPKTAEIVVKKQEITKDYARNKTQETFERAVKSGDIPSQVACCRLFLQLTGQLENKLVVDVRHAIQMDERQRELCKHIADYSLRKGLKPSTDIQDVVCSPDNNNQDTIDAEFEDCNVSDDNDLQQ